MSMIMTICGPLVGRIGGDFSGQFAGYENFIVWCFATWIDRWRMNFTMALFWNLICAGPFCRWAMGKYLKSRQKKEGNHFEKEAEQAQSSWLWAIRLRQQQNISEKMDKCCDLAGFFPKSRIE